MTSPNYTLGRIEDLGGIDLERLADANFYLIKGISYIEAAQNIIRGGLSGLNEIEDDLEDIADNKPHEDMMVFDTERVPKKFIYQPLEENIPDE